MSIEGFFGLSPEHILDSVESSLIGTAWESRATGRCVALNSIENRVYEIELENSKSVVAKFYRPQRWTPDQINEEHHFLDKLHNLEIPVVTAIQLGKKAKSHKLHSKTLAQSTQQIYFSVFPKFTGRSRDELNNDELQVLGRYLARLHAVARTLGPSKRLKLDTHDYGYKPLELLEVKGFLNDPLAKKYKSFVADILKTLEPYSKQLSYQRVHGDCHLGNLLWAQGEPIFLDFDDMCVAPPVQDLWMLVGGRDEFAQRKMQILVEAYEEFHPFDRSSLRSIELLRILRLIHYSGWIAKRWEDPSFPRMFPHFATEKWWQEDIEALSSAFQFFQEQISGF